MGKQSEVAAHIERLSSALKASKDKFENAMNQGKEFAALKKILREIKDLEGALHEYQKNGNGSA